MSNHEHYEELAALAAGGFLSDQEKTELLEHTKNCAECLKVEEEFRELVRSGLPLTVSPNREFVNRIGVKPTDGLRTRFFELARRQGLLFSLGVQKPQRPKRLSAVMPRRWRRSF